MISRRPYPLVFLFQVINNACATQAILSCLLNVDRPDVELGPTLSGFREFTASFDPSMKGLALSNSDEIRTVHNSFARQSIFEIDSKQANKDDDIFHFVAYVPIKGRIYELDGLQEGPIDHGRVPEGADWLDLVGPVIEKRMAKYQAGEIHFNLMAIVQDKVISLRKQLEVAKVKRGRTLSKSLSFMGFLFTRERLPMMFFFLNNPSGVRKPGTDCRCQDADR